MARIQRPSSTGGTLQPDVNAHEVEQALSPSQGLGAGGVDVAIPRLRTGKATNWASPKLTAPACSSLLPDSGPNNRSMRPLSPPIASKPCRTAPLIPEPAKQGWPVWRSRCMGLSITPMALPAPRWTGLTAREIRRLVSQTWDFPLNRRRR